VVDKSAALFRASNVEILDYPYQAAIESALVFVDEVVIVVDPNSRDRTWNAINETARWLAPGVIVASMHFHFDTLWQEKWWNKAASCTDAEWLWWWDLDEVIDPMHYDEIREAMDNPGTQLINFPFMHFYGTSSYVTKEPKPWRNTRLGRRSAGFKMKNRNDPKSEVKCAACNMEYDRGMAHGAHGKHFIQLDVPILHYSRCRRAQAVATYMAKHDAWYKDGDGLEDGRIPIVEPFDFKMKEQLETGAIQKYTGTHPACMSKWLAAHQLPWHYLNEEIRE